MTVALVRRTSSRLAEGLLTHIERQPVDIDLARKQWASYVQTLSEVGWNIVEVPELNSCADSVFIEDTVVIYGDVAIITNPGNDARKPEIVDVEPIVRGLGLRIHYIDSPGTLDGGDVLKVGQTVYVGRGGRTNQHGIDQFAEIVEPHGATVVTVPTTKALHLKSAVTALPDGTFIGWEPVVDDISVFPTFLSMPEEQGAHVVVVDDKRVLMSARAPRSAELLRQRGLQPILVDISEFEKLEGCVTCLSVRVRGN